MRTGLRFSGTGGQGIIRCAVLLAEAALYDGFHAAQSQVYGPESRGGSSKGEVVISDEPILYPKVVQPSVVLCLSQEAYDKYAADIRPDGILIIDSDFVEDKGLEAETVKVYNLPILETAKVKLGNEMSANVIALGAINGISDFVADEAIFAALENNFKQKLWAKNQIAYETGKEMVKNA